MSIKVHWKNPYDVIPVPIEELAACHDKLGHIYKDVDGSWFTMTEKRLLKEWCLFGNKLDAYILVQPSGNHCIGVRYGDEPSEYLSPPANVEKVNELLKKYR